MVADLHPVLLAGAVGVGQADGLRPDAGGVAPGEHEEPEVDYEHGDARHVEGDGGRH